MNNPDTPASGETVAALNALGALSDRLDFLAKALPNERDSAKVVRQFGATAAAPPDPPADFLEQLRRELVAASTADRLSELSGRQRRYAPWLLWGGDQPLAQLPGLVELAIAEARRSRASLRRLIQVFVRDFDAKAPGVSDVARCIREELGASDDPRLECWRAAQRDLQLFDPASGPRKLAASLLGNEEPGAVMSRYRLEEPILAGGRYLAAVEDVIRAATPELLRKHGTRALTRLIQILAPDGQLRFPARRADTARALLRAWLDARGEPASALQEHVRRLLLNWIGDPRLSQQRWTEVGEQETSLMRRWLARASLDLFFKLIDRQHPSGYHWPYRRAFWFAYLEKEAISDAWLALGTDAYNSAAAVRELGHAYGRLVGEARQSALLLRIGPLVISEFTNIGKVRAWSADWTEAPQLGLREYSRYDLMGTCLPFPPNPYRGRGGSVDGNGLSHFNSRQGYWQGSAAALIERHAGIRTTPNEWYVR